MLVLPVVVSMDIFDLLELRENSFLEIDASGFRPTRLERKSTGLIAIQLTIAALRIAIVTVVVHRWQQ